MRCQLKTIFIICCACMLYLQARATHAAGGELTYTYLSGSTYSFIFKFYRACDGASPAPSGISLCGQNECNNVLVYGTLIPPALLPNGQPNGSLVDPGCTNDPTICNGGTLPGYEEWWYTGTITLPDTCHSWIISLSIFARNAAININSDGGNAQFYIQATINNAYAPNNSSPYFTVKPVPYACVNSFNNYNLGAVDPDGDSLAFELMDPQTYIGSSCPVTPSPVGFSSPIYNLTDNPFSTANTFQLDGQTGQMSFTPDILQKSIFTVRVKEYRNSVLIGTIMRDVQINVLACNNPTPGFSPDTANITGGSYINGVLHTCAGNTIDVCYKIFTDNPNSVLLITDNVQTSVPGMATSYSGLYTDSVTGCAHWSPSLSDTGLHVLTVTVRDSLCLPPGIIVPQTFSIPLRVDAVTEIKGDSLICLGDTTQLIASGGNQFSWTVISGDQNSLSCTSCAAPFVAPTVTTIYKVQSDLSSLYCKTEDSFTVNVTNGAVIDIGPDLVKCKNDTLHLALDIGSLNAPDYDFSWLPATDLNSYTSQQPFTWTQTDKTYTVIVSPKAHNSCRSFDTIHIKIATDPSFEADTAICFGDNLHLVNTSTGTVSSGWAWNFGDGDTSSDKDPQHLYASPGVYKISLIAFPCGDTAYRTISVDSTPSIRFITGKNDICEGKAVGFYPEYTSHADTLLWDFGDGTGKMVSFQPMHAFDSAGKWIVTLTGKYPNCPDDSYSDTVAVHAYAPVNLGRDTSLCVNGNPIQLYDHNAHPQGYFYTWNTGDNSQQILARHPGIYALTVTTDHGCQTNDSVEIFKDCYLDIPNAFTPNGDGVNDYFLPRQQLSSKLTEFSMQIFNRWGQIIFETESIDGRGWDGKFNEKEQPQGVYIYIISAEIAGKARERYNGNVTLIR